MGLTDFKALTFDVYGTLIDWESGMAAALEPLTMRVPGTLSRDEILEAHAYHESRTQAQTPAKRYPDLLENSGFRRAFEGKGRRRGLMERIPTRLITYDQPGLLGAAYCVLELSS